MVLSEKYVHGRFVMSASSRGGSSGGGTGDRGV